MFLYTANEINELEKSISTERLSTYLKATNGDKKKAVELYLWNSKTSAAFYFPLQSLEITFRNALHTALSAYYRNASWYDFAPLDAGGLKLVSKAKTEVQKMHGAVNPPHVVAELSFGFWLSLLNKQYHQNLWIPVLGKSFPHAKRKRSEIHHELDHLRLFRNRIAHHESIFKRHLAKDYSKIIEIVGWINQDKSRWVDHHSEVIALLVQKPSQKYKGKWNGIK